MSCPEGQQLNESGNCVDGSVGEKIYYDEYGFPIRIFGPNGASGIVESKYKKTHATKNIFQFLFKSTAVTMGLVYAALAGFSGYLGYKEFEGDNTFILAIKVIGCIIFWIFYLAYRSLRVIISK